jgi:hypothetical protein
VADEGAQAVGSQGRTGWTGKDLWGSDSSGAINWWYAVCVKRSLMTSATMARDTFISLDNQASLVEAARLAIWRLFEEGYVDEDMATAGLLAIDLGMRRTHHLSPPNLHEHPANFRHKRYAAA